MQGRRTNEGWHGSAKLTRAALAVVITGTGKLAALACPCHPAPCPCHPETTIEQAVTQGVKHLLECQEGEPETEWPYEGVYRVDGHIPIGYRVGGTAIAALALTAAPGYAGDAPRREAVRRATLFVTQSIEHPLMQHRVESRYDVRGWGWSYGLLHLAGLKRLNLEPDGQSAAIDAAIRFFIDGIQATAIPGSGGWNYSRPRGFDAPGPAAPFMTAPTLMALYDAAALGYAVDGATVEKGLAALERSRAPSGAFAYSGPEDERATAPGAAARMAAAEIALFRAGRSDASRLRGAVDAFIAHWSRLEERRARPGTHDGPFGIAPYYFMYGHLYAAQAAELLPGPERPEYRRRIRELLFRVREDDGTWNDRVFPRSAGFGTSMAMLALMAPQAPDPARWPPAAPGTTEEER